MALLRKETYNLRHPRHLRHPVSHFVSLRLHVWKECLIFKRHFPQKSHIINGSFAKNDQKKYLTKRRILKSIVLFLVLLWQTFSIGWRRLMGCLKLQVVFRKRATNYMALLRKMTYEDKASYDSTPPCNKLTSEKI